MGTSFPNQNFIAVSERIQSRHTPHRLCQITFIPGKQNGEGSQHNLFGRIRVHLVKHLTVGNHQTGRLSQFLQCLFQTIFLYHNRRAVSVQNIPDGLLLGKNQSAFGGSFINRNHQNQEIPRLHQISHNIFIRFLLLSQPGNLLFQLPDIRFLFSADPDFIFFAGRLLSHQIQLIVHHHIRNGFILKTLNQHLILRLPANSAVYHQQSHIRLIQHLIAFLHPELPQFSLVINTRRVNHHHRAQWQKLHRLIDRVCSSSLHLRHNGQILACHCINHAGFPCISFSKKTDMYPLRSRCLIHSHKLFLSCEPYKKMT